MPETVTCPGCDTQLQLASMPAPGKKLRCPQCKVVFAPARLDEDEPEEKRSLAKTRRREADDDDGEDDLPKRKRGRSSTTFEFDGSAGDFFVVYVLYVFLTAITFGLASPWTMCMLVRWQTEHTLINGRRLRFEGAGSSLLGLFIVTYFLVLITLGIYIFWAVPKIIRWFTEHIEFEDAE